MAKYSEKANKTVESALHRQKKGSLTSGRSGRKVKSRAQAIAIGISEAREKGQKVPAKKAAKKKAGRKKSASKKSATKKKSSRKSSGRKSTGRKTSRKKSSG